MRTIAAELVSAYENTAFEVFGSLPVVLSVKDAPGSHDGWLESNGCNSAVIITAWNPFSEETTRAQNEQANARLRLEADALKLRSCVARGADTSATWSEESLCIFNVPDDVVNAWLIGCRQNAVLRVKRGGRPTLVWHPDVTQ